MTYNYDAFGNVTVATGSIQNSILYAGYQYDGELGMYYLNARYYDPVAGRFTSSDTYLGQISDPLSLNLYTYCENEPVMNYDPSGHVSAELWWEYLKGHPDVAEEMYINQLVNEGVLQNSSDPNYYKYAPEYLKYSNATNYTSSSQGRGSSTGTTGPASSGNQKSTSNPITNTDVCIGTTQITSAYYGNDGHAYANADELIQALSTYGFVYDGFDGQYYYINGTPFDMNSIVAMSDLVNAYGLSDCLSWWVESGTLYEVIQPLMKDAPVKMVRKGNDVYITADVYIQTAFNGRDDLAYKSAVVNGIMKFWDNITVTTKTGTNLTVHTVVNQVVDPLKTSFHISLLDDIGRAYTYPCKEFWSASPFIGKMVILYTGDSNTPQFSIDQIGDIAAHEFGHILGIDDAYLEGSRPQATAVPSHDVMNDEFKSNACVSAVDVLMALQAFFENSFQYYEYYDNHSPSKAI